jgi:peptide/nickel transport system permease protein
MIGGSVIIETIFSIPGLGQLGYESVLARDYPTVLALLTVSAVLTLVGILISDILLSIVDPRIAFGRRLQ